MAKIAFLSYSTAEWDARTQRMARSAIAAGHEVTVYARWKAPLALEEEQTGYRIVRVPTQAVLVIPGFRWLARRGSAASRDGWPRDVGEPSTNMSESTGRAAPAVAPAPDLDPVPWVPAKLRGTPAGLPFRAAKQVWRKKVWSWVARMVSRAMPDPLLIFPVRPIAWGIALEGVAEPADIWHGMWAGSLPALHRLRGRHGGRSIYDSRDVYMRSRGFERLGVLKAPLAWLERRWARRADAVLTVNEAYASLLARQFGIDPPPVVRNTPDLYTPPPLPPDLIRAALRISPDLRVVLYQGGLLSDRGIEQGMEAILHVERAVFVIMGVGKPTRDIEAMAASDRMQGHVRFLDPVPPDQLLDWTASADVMLMAIQPTSVNHRFTTPQKLWEAIAAGIPVVATDLPGMAEIVRDVGCGALVDATDPADIARGIRSIVDAPADVRRAMRERTWRAGQERFNWEREADTLLDLYRELLDGRRRPVRAPASASKSAT
jgi:glycosyltransferase involved in cell wall biosynthesis